MKDGFFESLFDFSFNKLVTTKVAKVVYMLAVIGISLVALAFLIGGLSQGGFNAFISLIVAPLFWILGMVLARIYLEVVIVLFKISENTYNIHATLAATHGGQGPQTPPSSPSPPPQSPGSVPDEPTS